MPRRSRQASLRELSRALATAQADLARARRRLAAATVPEDPSFLVDGRARWAERVLEHHRARLMKRPEVVGFGLGYRDGHPFATLYTRARSKDVPRTLRWKRRALPVELVVFGRGIDRQLGCGSSIGRTGPDSKGTLGCFATGPHGRPVALSAMHVMEDDALDPGDPPVVVSSPSRKDSTTMRVIGQAIHGTQHGIDAVRIDLAANVVPDYSLPGIGPIAGWRPTVYPADVGAVVRTFGATSGALVGRITNPGITLPSYELEDAIVVSMPTAPGDSGAAIVDNQNLVLGFLVGRGVDMPADLRLFCPAGLVLRRLGCTL